MSEFVFGVMTYNQADIVVETLESIKYQIAKYGEEFVFSLIITDDSSTDNTVEIVDKWLNKNEDLFVKIDKHYNKENHGVPYNYNYILRKIGLNPFKIIAGDDLISSNNIFLYSKQLQMHQLGIGMRCYLKDDNIFMLEADIIRQFYYIRKKIDRKTAIKWIRSGGFIHTPSTLYSAELYRDSNAEELNNRFMLFEDDPTWYSMAKNVTDFSLSFFDTPIVLYRLSNKSISNSKGTKISKRFAVEMDKLINIYIDEADFWTEKIALRSRLSSSHIPIIEFIKKTRTAYCCLYALLHPIKYYGFRNHQRQNLLEEIEYYKEIRKEV